MKTKKLTLAAMFAALCAVTSQIVIPVGASPVPINPALATVMISGGVLGIKYGALSQLVYIFAGLAGMPVFAGMRGGIGVLAEPGGGFIIGYVFAVIISGIVADKNINRVFPQIVMMCASVLACYICGTVYFMILTNSGISAAALVCVFPFLPGDAIKIATAVFVLRRIKRYI